MPNWHILCGLSVQNSVRLILSSISFTAFVACGVEKQHFVFLFSQALPQMGQMMMEHLCTMLIILLWQNWPAVLCQLPQLPHDLQCFFFLFVFFMDNSFVDNMVSLYVKHVATGARDTHMTSPEKWNTIFWLTDRARVIPLQWDTNEVWSGKKKKFNHCSYYFAHASSITFLYRDTSVVIIHIP